MSEALSPYDPRPGISFDDLLDQLSSDQVAITDPNILALLPDIHSEAGMQIWGQDPPAGKGMAYRSSDLRWDSVRSGDIVRGSFLVHSALAMQEALDGQDTVAIRVRSNDIDEVLRLPPPMHVQYPRNIFEGYVGALRKLTGHHLIMDMLVLEDLDTSDMYAQRLAALPLRVMALEQPFHRGQLPYFGYSLRSGIANRALVAGTVLSTEYEASDSKQWLRLALPDKSVQRLWTYCQEHYQPTVDGQPIPVTPQPGDFVHINALYAPQAANTHEPEIFRYGALYRIAAAGGEIAEMNHVRRYSELLANIEDMYTDNAYPAFREALAELVHMRIGESKLTKVYEKYRLTFRDMGAEAPLAFSHNEGFNDAFLQFSAFFNVDLPKMTVEEFKAFSRQILYGVAIPIPESQSVVDIAQFLFGIDDKNPELVSEAIDTVIPACARGNITQLSQLQLDILSWSLLYVDYTMPRVDTAKQLVKTLDHFLAVLDTRDHPSQPIFSYLQTELIQAIRDQLQDCQSNLDDPECIAALWIYASRLP